MQRLAVVERLTLRAQRRIGLSRRNGQDSRWSIAEPARPDTPDSDRDSSRGQIAFGIRVQAAPSSRIAHLRCAPGRQVPPLAATSTAAYI